MNQNINDKPIIEDLRVKYNRTLILTSVMKICKKYKRGMARLAWVPRVVVAEGWLVNVIITRRRGGSTCST